MGNLRLVDIDGKRYLWRDTLERHRAQRRTHAPAQQPALFLRRHDCRPAARTPSGRYFEPSLFEEER
jgi:hypothetical protein